MLNLQPELNGRNLSAAHAIHSIRLKHGVWKWAIPFLPENIGARVTIPN